MTFMEVIHRCPVGDSGVMPCCGKTPFEVPLLESITLDPDKVTCDGQGSDQDRIQACKASQGWIDIRHTCGLSGKMFFQAEPHAHQGEQCVDWAHCTRTSDQQNGGPTGASAPVN